MINIMEKEKLGSREFMLIVNGPSCGGKTTVSELFLKRFKNVFNASGDKIKWLLSDYNAEIHKGIIHDMILEIIKVALKNNLSVLKQGALYEAEVLLKIAKENNIPVFIANVSAPDEVLKKRFEERILAQKEGARISNVNKERFWQLNQIFLSSKMESPLDFDSSTQSPEEIVDTIAEYIKNNL